VLVATMDGPVRLFSLDGKLLGSFPADSDRSDRPPSWKMPTLAFRPDATQFAYSRGDVTQIWDVASNRKTQAIFKPGTGLSYMLGGANLVISDDRGTHTADPGYPFPYEYVDDTTPLQFSQNATTPLRFSKDEKYMVSGWKGEPDTVVLTELTSGETRRVQVNAPRDLAFSPDGQWIAILGDDGVSIHRTVDGREVLTFRPGEQAPSRVYFGKDSTELITVQSSSVRLWKLP